MFRSLLWFNLNQSSERNMILSAVAKKNSLLWLYALAKNNNYGWLYSGMPERGHLQILLNKVEVKSVLRIGSAHNNARTSNVNIAQISNFSEHKLYFIFI
jgi:hypothetical protein